MRSHNAKFARVYSFWAGGWMKRASVETSNYTKVSRTHASRAAKMNGEGYNERWRHSDSQPTGIWPHVTRLCCDVMRSGNSKGRARVTGLSFDGTLLFSHNQVQIFFRFVFFDIHIDSDLLSFLQQSPRCLFEVKKGAAVQFLEDLFCFKRFIMSWRNNIFTALMLEKLITVPWGWQRIPMSVQTRTKTQCNDDKQEEV